MGKYPEKKHNYLKRPNNFFKKLFQPARRLSAGAAPRACSSCRLFPCWSAGSPCRNSLCKFLKQTTQSDLGPVTLPPNNVNTTFHVESFHHWCFDHGVFILRYYKPLIQAVDRTYLAAGLRTGSPACLCWVWGWWWSSYLLRPAQCTLSHYLMSPQWSPDLCQCCRPPPPDWVTRPGADTWASRSG